MDALEQWLDTLPAAAHQHQAAIRDIRGLFRVVTRQGRSRDILLAGGSVQVLPCGTDAPTCTITADEGDLLAMLQGRLNPAKALLLGKVKVTGDPKPLLRLAALLK